MQKRSEDPSYVRNNKNMLKMTDYTQVYDAGNKNNYILNFFMCIINKNKQQQNVKIGFGL